MTETLPFLSLAFEIQCSYQKAPRTVSSHFYSLPASLNHVCVLQAKIRTG